MNYTNHTQDHRVDIQKLTQDQNNFIEIVIVTFYLVLTFFFYLAHTSRNKKIETNFDHSEPEDIFLDPKERIMVQNLRASGLF